MKKYKLFTLLLILTACSSSNKGSVLLEQAAAIHNEMVLSAEQLEKWLTLQESDTTSTVPADSLAAWKVKLEVWEEEIVEVPGNEAHESHETGEHHHDHSTIEVTDDQMLVIQQELSGRLKQLEEQIKPYRNK